MKYKNIIKLRLPEIQLLAVVPTALLNNARKVGRLVLSRTSCFFSYNHISAWSYSEFVIFKEVTLYVLSRHFLAFAVCTLKTSDALIFFSSSYFLSVSDRFFDLNVDSFICFVTF
jgi:hypothetical protein